MNNIPLPQNLQASRDFDAIDLEKCNITQVRIDGVSLLNWLTLLELHYIRNEEMASDVLKDIRECLSKITWSFKNSEKSRRCIK